jgi:prepilin peptidase CpaA
MVALVSVVVLVAVIGFTVAGAVWDIRTNRLPNWITVPSAILGVAFHAIAGALQGPSVLEGAWHGLQHSLAGFAAGFFPLLLVWLIGAAGAGDVKLLGAVGAWLGLRLTLYTYVLSMMMALLVSLAVLVVCLLRSRAAGASRGKSDWRRVPYGVPVALATWVVLLWNLLRPAG